MNIVQISEQLKDVPDQFLMQEIQNPTGSYPSYLVVSELTRRKRMREGAVKQEPTTSVAEDLVGISATPQAAQSTLGAAQQMMAQPQPQQMPEMGMNVPQMGMAQMGTPMMAGGGLVAFEQGGPIRAQEGLFADLRRYVLPYEDEERSAALGESIKGVGQSILGATSDIPLPRFTPYGAEPEKTPFGRFMRERLSPLEDPGFVPSETPAVIPQPTRQTGTERMTDQGIAMVAQQQAALDRENPVAKGTEPSAQQKMAGEAPPPKGGGLGAFKVPAFPTAQYEAAMNMPMPTEAEIAGTRKRATEEFEQAIPDRTSKLLEERILRKTEQLQKDKDMTFNEALFAAGAAILSAPGGGGMKWAGEGLKAFGQTLAEGKKDIRRSQDLIDQANIDLANAQSLRDQGKINAADKAENKAFERFAQGRALAQSDAALALQQFNSQITAAKAPYEMAESQSKAEAQSALANVYRQGGAGALTAAAKANEPPEFGKVMAFKAAYLADYPNATKEQVEAAIKNQFPSYRPMLPPKPEIRGLEAPATLPGT